MPDMRSHLVLFFLNTVFKLYLTRKILGQYIKEGFLFSSGDFYRIRLPWNSFRIDAGGVAICLATSSLVMTESAI